MEWLEAGGHATVQVGLKRSTLVSEELDQAQEGNILSRTTLSLFYATDFADQLENIILPALKAGFIVLADRYIYTLMARDMVRGMDEAWLKNLYGIALEPDAVFYLEVDAGGTGAAQSVARRRRWITGRAAWTWACRAIIFDSFVKYQTAMQAAFRQLQKTYGFTIVNGNRSVDAVTVELRKKIGAVLEGSEADGRLRMEDGAAEGRPSIFYSRSSIFADQIRQPGAVPWRDCAAGSGLFQTRAFPVV